MKKRRTRIILGVSLAIGLLVGGLSALRILLPRGEVRDLIAQSKLGRWLGFTRDRCQSIYDQTMRLEVGMDKDAVRRIIGDPDNVDSTYVWYWVADAEKRKPQEKTWRLMAESEQPGFFLIFDGSGCLLSVPIKTAEGDPREAYEGYGGGAYTPAQLDGMLGQE